MGGGWRKPARGYGGWGRSPSSLILRWLHGRVEFVNIFTRTLRFLDAHCSVCVCTLQSEGIGILGSWRLWMWLGRGCWPSRGHREDSTHGPCVALKGNRARLSQWLPWGGLAAEGEKQSVGQFGVLLMVKKC